MDISELLSNIHKLPDGTSLSKILYYEQLIFSKIQEEENTILQEYLAIKSNLELEILTKQKKLDREYQIHQDIIAEYFKKRDKYKFPENLIILQNQIQVCHSNLENNKNKIITHRQDKIKILQALQKIEHNKLLLVTTQNEARFQCDMLVSFWQEKMDDLDKKYQLQTLSINKKYNYKIDKFNLKLQNLKHQKELLILKELELKFKTQTQISIHQKEILKQSAKLTHDAFVKLNLENLKLQIKFEKKTEIKNKEKLCQKIKSIIKQEKQTMGSLFAWKQKQKEILKKNLSSYQKSIDENYDLLENIIVSLKNYDYQFHKLKEEELVCYQKLNFISQDIQERIYNNNLLLENSKKLTLEKDKIIPGIVRKYKFYMNFYHHNLGESKIKIKLYEKDIIQLQETNLIDILNVSVSNQKINILKKLQTYINKKFYVASN